MRAGWEHKRVADIAQHSLGKMLDKAKNKGEPRPYLRNLNVRWFDFDLSDVLEMRFLPSEEERYSVRKGDVLVCEGGYPGRAAIWDCEELIFFQKALHRVRFRDSGIARWFVYYLRSKDLDGTLSEHFNGSGIQHFTGEALARFEVPLPPRDDRERIVNVLDEAFEGITTARANAERNLRNARALFESRFDTLFSTSDSYPGVPIGSVAEVFDGPHATPRTVDEGPIFLGISALQDGRINLGETRHVTAEDFRIWTRRVRPQAGDVVFSYETRLGQAALIPDGLECCLGRRMGLVRVDRARLDPRYFVYQYLAPPMQRFLAGKTVRGATVDRIPVKDFPSFPIVLPPLPEQRRTADLIERLRDESDALVELYRRKLAALDELKRSLLHHAFTGQLTARTAAALGA